MGQGELPLLTDPAVLGRQPPTSEKEDAHTCWEASKAHERLNGRLFQEMEIALPTELMRSERVEVAREFAHFLTGRERLPYTLAVLRGCFAWIFAQLLHPGPAELQAMRAMGV